MNIIFKGSPNFDTNRKPITKLVVHWFGEGTLESANARFQNPASKVSAHYGISGNTVYQWVKEENVAYQAGNYTVNQESIGIEHDATTEHIASEETYRTSVQLVADICKKYNIPIDREHIRKHSEIKATQCPGTLDIDRIVREAKALSETTPTPPMNDKTKIPLNITTPLESYTEIELGVLKSKLLAKDTRIEQLESPPVQPAPVFKKPFAQYLNAAALEFEKL